MIEFKQTGEFETTKSFLNRARSRSYANILRKYGKEGVKLLSSATPVDSGNTANSWNYEIKEAPGKYAILFFTNSNIVDGVSIAVVLQYGHVSRGGGYVRGIDYINPTLRPLFDKIAEDAWKEVTRQ